MYDDDRPAEDEARQGGELIGHELAHQLLRAVDAEALQLRARPRKAPQAGEALAGNRRDASAATHQDPIEIQPGPERAVLEGIAKCPDDRQGFGL